MRPAWSNLVVDPAGRVWLRAATGPGDAEAWEIFDSDGVLLARLYGPMFSPGLTVLGHDEIHSLVETDDAWLLEVWRMHVEP